MENNDLNQNIENSLNIDKSLNSIAMSSIVKKIKSQTKEIVWKDDNPFNFSDTPIKKLEQWFDNIENDEFQIYLKLREKYEK